MEKNFYKDLKCLKLPVTSVFQQRYFSNIPPRWSIIISDVKNSTAAVAEGRHNDVNLVAAGSLIAALNIAKERNVDIPFFFGGDGGTFLVPEEILNDVLLALAAHNLNSIKNFDLAMHIGHMRVGDVLSEDHFIKIAKLQLHEGFSKPVIIGDGLKYAEQYIKHSLHDEIPNAEDQPLNLNGLECRWDRIKPPEEENEIVCYLIEAVDPAKQLEIYKDVLEKIDAIYGDIVKRHPLSLNRLKLLFSFDKLRKEMLAKYGKWKINYLISSFLKTFLGRSYFKYNWNINNLRGKEYLNQVIANSDTLIIDGRINTIISGRMDKRLKFIDYLTGQEKLGNLVFGHHISKESVMTCYIQNRNAEHIHFVDGADGGYTEAAKELKKKFFD